MLDGGRYFGEDIAGDEAVALEAAKRLGQGVPFSTFGIVKLGNEMFHSLSWKALVH